MVLIAGQSYFSLNGRRMTPFPSGWSQLPLLASTIIDSSRSMGRPPSSLQFGWRTPEAGLSKDVTGPPAVPNNINRPSSTSPNTISINNITSYLELHITSTMMNSTSNSTHQLQSHLWHSNLDCCCLDSQLRVRGSFEILTISESPKPKSYSLLDAWNFIFVFKGLEQKTSSHKLTFEGFPVRIHAVASVRS